MLTKQKTLSNELKDGIKIKSEITQDFQKLQKQVEMAANERQSLQEDLSQLESEAKEKSAQI